MANADFTALLTKKELAWLTDRSDLSGVVVVTMNWLLIAFSFALVVCLPNVATALLAVLVLGGRQLGLGIIVHDCAHSSLFRSRWLNEFVGEWLAAAPTNTSLLAYRAYHMKHHRYAGTSADPDIGFVRDYPVTPASLRRKFLRDLTGQTGLRDLVGELNRFDVREQWPFLLFHIGLLAVLSSAGAPWTYPLWWIARIFVYPAIVRLRQIGEHGVAQARGQLDPRGNTSTTLVAWWERLFIAPNNVSWHLEHHLAANVPSYKLGHMHRLLKSRGFYDGHDCISRGYLNVLRRAVRNE